MALLSLELNDAGHQGLAAVEQCLETRRIFSVRPAGVITSSITSLTWFGSHSYIVAVKWFFVLLRNLLRFANPASGLTWKMAFIFALTGPGP